MLKIKFIREDQKILKELYEDGLGDNTFKNAKEAVRWCNEMFRTSGDRRYKQIANYLHIYL